jgi:hypothetical protein
MHNQKYKCEYCDELFIDYPSLIEHKKTHPEHLEKMAKEGCAC